MKLVLLSVFLTICLLASVSGQSFSGEGGDIVDDGNGRYFLIEIGNLTQSAIDSVFGIESVSINLIHPYDSELEVRLFAPDGSNCLLTNANGGAGDNYSTTLFTDYATNTIINGTAPFDGSFMPQEPLASLNNGQASEGTWRLFIHDFQPNNGNMGTLVNWILTFGYNPGPLFPFSSSNLPIFYINTHGLVIPDEPKIPIDFSILYNGAGERNYISDSAYFQGSAGIEIRGSSSQMFPKKSYGFETWDLSGQEIDTSLLGMPAESDWILNANYSDKTLCRNVLSYQTWMNMGYYATRYRYVELIVNNEYMGIYILSEKIKRSKKRLNIAKLKPEDIAGDEVTGGYILKIDKSTGSGGAGWVSPFPPYVNTFGQTIYIQYDYPQMEDINEPQKLYIEDYVNQFETALSSPQFTDTSTGYRQYAQEGSFFDYFLVNEISKNVDGYRLSAFFNKERDSEGGKIRMGPVWDYDIAWHNADYCDGDQYTGWAYQFPCNYDTWQVPFWWARLLEDPLYASHLQCRWLLLRNTILSDQYFNDFIDSIASQLDEAQTRNFVKWPILGTYVWPNPYPYPETYAGEISSLKSWIGRRLAWLDEYMPGTCYTVGQTELSQKVPGVEISPNPATSLLIVGSEQYSPGKVKLDILSQSGIVLITVEGGTRNPGFYSDQINIEDLSPGVYILRVSQNNREINRKVVKY